MIKVFPWPNLSSVATVKGLIFSKNYWYYFNCPKNLPGSIVSFVIWIFPPSDTAVQLESANSKHHTISKSLFQNNFRHIFWAMRKMHHTFRKKATFRESCSPDLTMSFEFQISFLWFVTIFFSYQLVLKKQNIWCSDWLKYGICCRISRFSAWKSLHKYFYLFWTIGTPGIRSIRIFIFVASIKCSIRCVMKTRKITWSDTTQLFPTFLKSKMNWTWRWTFWFLHIV